MVYKVLTGLIRPAPRVASNARDRRRNRLTEPVGRGPVSHRLGTGAHQQHGRRFRRLICLGSRVTRSRASQMVRAAFCWCSASQRTPHPLSLSLSKAPHPRQRNCATPSRASKSKPSSAISASFFARDQPLNCRSAPNASSREGKSSDQTSSTGSLFAVRPPQAPLACWDTWCSESSTCPACLAAVAASQKVRVKSHYPE